MVLVAAALLGVAVMDSCSTTPSEAVAPLTVPGAHYVGNQACAQCHAQICRRFLTGPHARIFVKTAKMTGSTGCESCHGPASRHIEFGGDPRFIINPGTDPASCFRCHPGVQAEFHLPYHHPVIENHMSCVQCHDPHGQDMFKPAGGLAMARQNESCAQCHREQTRPFVFEHEAMREGCTVCHNPHGSVNRAMLVESDPNLCLRCHAQTQAVSGHMYIGNVDHTDLLPFGTCWTAGCHTAIHGSNVDPLLRY